MPTEERMARTQRLVFGLVLVALGLVFTLDRMDVIDAGSLTDFWPLFFVAIGLTKVMQPAGMPGRGFGAVLIAVGVWWTLHNLGLVEYGLRDLWPLLLVAIGLSLLWRALRRPAAPALPPQVGALDFAPPGTAAAGTVDVAAPPPAPGAAAVPTLASFDPTVHMVAILGGAERNCAARGFRGGDLTAIMGGCNLDLRQAEPVAEGAVLEVFAMWGGVEIRVPDSWAVSMQGTPILGAFEDTRKPLVPPTGGRLVVRGFAIMGGVEVKS